MPRLIALLIAAAVMLPPAAHAADDEFSIKARPKEVTNERLQQLVKQLNDAPPALAPAVPPKAPKDPKAPAPAAAPAVEFQKTELAAKFAEEAKSELDAWLRLMIPPNFPKAAQKADANVRARAAWVLGLTRDRRVMKTLVNTSVYDPDEPVREAAALALPLLEEPIALRMLTDLACASDYTKYPWIVRQNAARALVRYGDREAVERLLRELSYELAAGNPYDSKNRMRGVSRGLGTDNPMMLPDGPPDLKLSEEDMYPVLSATKIVTGKSFDSGDKDMKTWLAWWKKEGPAFTFPTLKALR
ncbi:MAG TPA: HEAT repeat domain-containing protein [Planctomycetota bacterium]|nr:HEAT repeat domain-containing protein [Planctomycetota bacterium]